MKKLNGELTKKYAYVKNNIIFEKKNYDNGDSCVVPFTEENIDSITVDGTKLFLDCYVEDGDTYRSGKFKKTVHDDTASGETEMSLIDFYKKECEDEIAASLVNGHNYTYDDFCQNYGLLGVPTFMIEQSGNVVVPQGTQIDFSENYYNDTKLDEVKKLAIKASEDTAEKYGYEVKSITLEISKK